MPLVGLGLGLGLGLVYFATICMPLVGHARFDGLRGHEACGTYE